MRVVVDTNVFVSSLLSPTGAPARLRDFWEAGQLELLLSDPILAEYARVLAYPRVAARLRLSGDQIAQLVVDLRQQAVVVSTLPSVDVVAQDPSDNRILECAAAGGAEYIVSGDAHLLALGEYAGIAILPPAALVALLIGSEPSGRD